MEAQPSYRHAQFGTVIVAALGTASLPAALLFRKEIAAIVPLAMLLVLAACLVLFFRLTVEVGPVFLQIRFGIGLVRKKVALEEIVDVSRVRNRWFYGWGVRLTPHGWLYNVSGLEAVELALRSGTRMRIGTDDPEGLEDALRSTLRQG